MSARSLLPHINTVWKAQTIAADNYVTACNPHGSGFDTLISMFFMLSGIHIGYFRGLFNTVGAICSSAGADAAWVILTWALDYLHQGGRAARVRNPAAYLAALMHRCPYGQFALPCAASTGEYTAEGLLLFPKTRKALYDRD